MATWRHKLSFLVSALVLLCSCGGEDQPSQGGGKQLVKGADISWCTEMESKGMKFYSASGQQMECTELMKSLGFNAVRYRVWVNPADGWNNVDDVLEKCRRAKSLGMDIMIDFHYSDSWADPGKQTVPEAWESYSLEELAKAVSDHTTQVLGTLSRSGIDVSWVQVGNEVSGGMLWEHGRVSGNQADGFATLFKAGADAVRSIYPKAKTVLHVDNAWNRDMLMWFFGLMKAKALDYDVIGLSLYPSWWDDGIKGYSPWKEKVDQAVANIPELGRTFDKEVLLVEWGMPQSEPGAAREALSSLMRRLSSELCFKGVFYWEPESESSRNGGYSYGAFSGGKPTAALDPFSTF